MASDTELNVLFQIFQEEFLSHCRETILAGLQSVFDGQVSLSVFQVDHLIAARFMRSISRARTRSVEPKFHGTEASNHESIASHGLLIPGRGNNIIVANGSAHGLGIYTANIDAAWLSKSFCSTPQLLVCAVLDSPAVRHVRDASVIFDESHVVPVAVATGCWGVVRHVHGIRACGFPALRLLDSANLKRLVRYGVSANVLREVGFTASELQIWFTASELRKAGFTLSDLHTAGFMFEHIETLDERTVDLCKAGYISIADARRSGCPVFELLQAGCSTVELRSAGVTLDEILEILSADTSFCQSHSGVTASELRAAGYSFFSLRNGGFQLDELTEAGFTRNQILALSMSDVDLEKAGHVVAGVVGKARHDGTRSVDLMQAGHSLPSLVNGGFTAPELESDGFTVVDLLQGGCTALDFKRLGYTAAQLRAAGCSATALKHAGYKKVALKSAGFSMDTLKRAGFKS